MGVTAARETVVRTGDLIEGRYRIIKTLGAGGMGTVFLAEHALIKRRVAMKILHDELATDAHVVERFMNEARAAGTLGHPNIVESTDMGFTQDHVPYIVFEYLEGTLLTDEIYRVGGLPVRRAVWIATQIASALEAAHRANIVHRDLKSDNIFLTDKDDALDHVKVLDFGVSRFLEAEERQRNMVVGTPEFMAPEQITDPDHVDKRADIYALGVILYEMLTARRPFSVDDDPQLLMHHIVTKAPPPLLRNEVPHGLSSMILERLLAKDREDRYQTMGDVQAALEQFVTREGVPMPRRRTSPAMAVVRPDFDDTHETSARLPRTATGKPVSPRDTPWPVTSLDTPVAMGQVALPSPPPVKRPYALYGIAGGGILMGMIGLVVGMRGGDAPAPAPVVVQQTAPVAATMPAPAAPEKIEVSLGADVANARVVFRRRVHEVPAKMEINATDVVELVEVSAAGYKTTRYWLTFDRPTYLKAHLVKGSGSVEATEEETLAALGEVIMVTGSAPTQVAAAPARTSAPAAAMPAAAMPAAAMPAAAMPAAKTVEKPAPAPAATQVAMAPRKIGRSAADAEPASEPAIVDSTSQPAPAGESSSTQSAEAEKAVDAAKPDVKAGDVVVDKPVEKPADKPADKVAERPADKPIDIARPQLDRATVSSVITAHRPQVLKCFADGKKKNAAMKGTLTLQLQVNAAGAVTRAQVQSTLNNPLVAACVVKAANTWKFPARAGGEVATVAYPFTIN